MLHCLLYYLRLFLLFIFFSLFVIIIVITFLSCSYILKMLNNTIPIAFISASFRTPSLILRQIVHLNKSTEGERWIQHTHTQTHILLFSHTQTGTQTHILFFSLAQNMNTHKRTHTRLSFWKITKKTLERNFWRNFCDTINIILVLQNRYGINWNERQ